MFQRLLILAAALLCHQVSGAGPNPVQKQTNVEKLRDVEAIDPGLLTNNNNQTTGSTLGKQFSGNFPGQDPFGGTENSFGPGQNSGSFPQGQGSSLIPGTSGSFLPGQGVNFLPGQGGFNGNGLFPGQGLVPGGATLPPGSVAADTVAFSAARASDFTRVGITQVRFDYTITDFGYGWYPDRSEFVCYYPGIYFFAFSGLSPQTRQFKLSLVKNNLEVISSWGDSNGYQMGTNSAILALNRGDRVYLVLQEGALHEASTIGRSGYTTFSGFKIR